MVKIMVGLVLLVMVAVTFLLVMSWLLPAPQREEPSKFASNETWARYYRDLAEQARRDGNETSAADYESLARTYSTLLDIGLTEQTERKTS